MGIGGGGEGWTSISDNILIFISMELTLIIILRFSLERSSYNIIIPSGTDGVIFW